MVFWVPEIITKHTQLYIAERFNCMLAVLLLIFLKRMKLLLRIFYFSSYRNIILKIIGLQYLKQSCR